MAKYKSYPEYKDSGVEWLREIPEHWKFSQVKYGYSITLGKMLQKEKNSYFDSFEPYLKAQNIQVSGLDLHTVDSMWFSREEKKKLLLEYNDILVSEGGDVGRSALWLGQMNQCYIQNAINRVRPQKNNSATFFQYWITFLKSTDFINIICNKATIAHYTVEKLASSPLLLPKKNEQQQIADFLDHEIAKIDTLIEKQQQLIELLKEKRQAVISHAVTKGLNPDVPMKASGVEWLGEIPEHWTISRFKFCTNRVVVGIAEAATHAYAENGIPIIRATNIKEDGLKTYELLFLKEKFANQNESKYLFSNDIVTVRTGYPGISAVVPNELNRSHCFTNLISTPLPDYNSQYLTEYLNSAMGKDFFALQGWGSAQRNISVPILQNFPISYPNKFEQNQITNFVKIKRSEYSLLIEKAEKSIRLMQERRTALISAAVTGKIDVRHWRAPNEHSQTIAESEAVV